MSLYALMLDGSELSALIVGGGTVAARKARALVAAGARVRIVAPRLAPELEALAAREASVEVERERYDSHHLRDEMLVIAATDDHATNARVVSDARASRRLVNAPGAPEEGNCVTPAVHSVGDVIVAVSAGGVPGAAARIRDKVAETIDGRYADAIRELSSLRRALIDAGNRAEWSAAASAVVDDSFCDRVEAGRFSEVIAPWR